MTSVQLQHIIEQGLQLSPQEQLQLAERMIAAAKNALPGDPPVAINEGEHWGEKLLQRLNEVGPIDLIHPEIEDPVEWVKQIRRDQERNLDWGDDK